MDEAKTNLTYLKIIIYLIIFFTIWSIRELVIRPIFLSPLDALAFEIVESTTKVLIWTVPAILLIKHYQNDMWISLKEMFTSKFKWTMLIPLLILIVYHLILAWVSHGSLAISPDFYPVRLFEVVIFAGITEELVFRGFLLNAFLKKMKVVPAVVTSEILFTLIHYPMWIYYGFDLAFFGAASIQVFITGVFFAIAFIKTKNIWVPIVMHSAWNLFLILLAR